MREYQRLDDSISRREEWMCAQALTTGAIQIVGKGVNEEIDFGFTNKVVLTGAEQWGQSGADILGMLEDCFWSAFFPLAISCPSISTR